MLTTTIPINLQKPKIYHFHSNLYVTRIVEQYFCAFQFYLNCQDAQGIVREAS